MNKTMRVLQRVIRWIFPDKTYDLRIKCAQMLRLSYCLGKYLRWEDAQHGSKEEVQGAEEDKDKEG